jgi:hypothetical protein
MKPRKRSFIVVSLTTREIPKHRGRYFLRSAMTCPRDDDLPKGFTRRQGYSWEEVVGTVCDPTHKGDPIYTMPDWQVARITRIVAKGD